MSPHHWQCDFHADQYAWECTCGLTGERHWICDVLPADRAPTDEERHAYLTEAERRRAEVPPTDREELAMAHEMIGGGGE
jgi:hypothetical protein